MKIIDKIKKSLCRHALLAAGDSVVVAVSGGPDSVCLLHALHSLSRELGITLHAAHLDHMFRGAESADDARFVAGFASLLGVPATVEAFDVPAFCLERGLAPQAGAREVRYRFLGRVADATGSARIATGHTADDQAETLLMRLLRGAGSAGLSGIPPRRGAVIRPLIDITRAEVMAYLNENSLAYRTDPSNAKPLYTRNRIRTEVLPVLRRFNPHIVEALAAESSLLRDEDEAMEQQLDAIADRILVREGETATARRDDMIALPVAFQRRLLRRIVDRIGQDASALNFALVGQALAFLSEAQTGRTMTLLPGLTVTREYDRIIFSAGASFGGFSIDIALPGITAVPGLGIEVTTAIAERPAPGPDSANYDWQARFDCDKIGPLLTLRSRRPGDWFCPAGMGGSSKKIQDFFVDEKVPRSRRDSIPLLASGDDLLWVIGFRADERFLPHPDTKRVLIVGVMPQQAREAPCSEV